MSVSVQSENNSMCNTIIKQNKKLEMHLAKELQDLCTEN